MRADVLVHEVLDKCDVLKQAGFWPAEPRLRPRAWLENFESTDRATAAYLLDKFTFYNHDLTDALFVASYRSICDGLPKGPTAPSSSVLRAALQNAVLTPVTGEKPNPSDSGNAFCRKARQILDIAEDRLVEPREALGIASQGSTVVFVDDFIGSGDQFLETWERRYSAIAPYSFSDAQSRNGFTAIYVSLVSTDFGLANIHRKAPAVAVSVTHVLGRKSTIQGADIPVERRRSLIDLLMKYSPRLKPKEDYIAQAPRYLAFGYKERGLLLGFQHSIPDATLPIFWSPGDNWEPLYKRA